MNTLDRSFKAEIIITDPIYYVVLGRRKYYLNANIFYSGIHFGQRVKIIDQAKNFLHTHFHNKRIPRLGNVSITLCFYHTRTNWDMDNREYFWKKVLLDYMKDLKKKVGGQTVIVDKRIIPDDDVSVVNEFHCYFMNGKPRMDIIIRGTPC